MENSIEHYENGMAFAFVCGVVVGIIFAALAFEAWSLLIRLW
jgi:hypothetical protein